MQSGIFIPGNVASGKNSKIWTGKYLIHSKTAQKYIKESEPYWISEKPTFLKLINQYNPPYKVGFFFIRGNRHKFDYHNVVQLPLDLMQKYEWIKDDCADIILPVFIGYNYDKNNPGLIINI